MLSSFFFCEALSMTREEAAGYLQLAAAPAEGLTRLLSPTRMQLLYSSLQVQPDGAPAALLLTEECTRLTGMFVVLTGTFT